MFKINPGDLLEWTSCDMNRLVSSAQSVETIVYHIEHAKVEMYVLCKHNDYECFLLLEEAILNL